MTVDPQIALSTQKHIEALNFISVSLDDINNNTNEAAQKNVSVEGLLSVAISAISALASVTEISHSEALLLLAESASAWSESTE
jgi:hypothetical protein